MKEEKIFRNKLKRPISWQNNIQLQSYNLLEILNKLNTTINLVAKMWQKAALNRVHKY